jgi:penicillin-binding protein 1A
MPRLSGLVRYFGIAALFLGAAVAGTTGGVLFAFVGDLPQIEALDDYTPPTITRVLGRNGTVVGEFATERRQVVTYDQIPKVLENAIVSAEDGDFFRHSGINIKAIAALAVRRVLGLQRRGGASTITQQLTRKLFLTDEQTVERKVKEMLLAVQVDKRYTKQEVITMYCNRMYWGHGVYGVEAASQYFFGKHVSALTLDEAALIAGMLQRNVLQSPFVNMTAAVQRRNYTLGRMAEEGYITTAEADAAKKRPIVTRSAPPQSASIAPYFLETLRIRLEEQFGSKVLYENGLTVKTGLDPALQTAANRALRDGLRRIDKQRGFRRTTENILNEKRSLDSYALPRWSRDPQPTPDAILPGIVMDVSGPTIHVRIGRFAGTIGATGYAWTRRKVQELVAPGDVVDVRILDVDAAKSVFTAALDQTPLLEGAVLAIDNRTGQIMAMIGGDSFERSKFNRATQALRQVGSLFKPIVYTAAIDRGYTAQSVIDDSPVSFNVGPGQPPYEPKNYDHEYHGLITLRDALEGSRNVPTIRLMDALGPREVIKYARQLGITSPLPEYLSVAIGAAEASLLEITSAYTAFPNQGVRMTPRMLLEVIDRDGNMIEQQRAQPTDALRADTAYIVTNLLQGVVEHGTAASARSLNWPLGGKTGTTDDYSDAWFVGFDPDITIGVWIGFDQKRSIGREQTGASAALPIWKEIMGSWIERRRKELPETPAFERPGNVATVTTSRGTDVFIAGTEPEPTTF